MTYTQSLRTRLTKELARIYLRFTQKASFGHFFSENLPRIYPKFWVNPLLELPFVLALSRFFKSGNLRLAVMLPEGEDLNEWVAVNTVDFFNQINMLYGTITEFCTEQSCPVMSAGPKYEVCVVTKTSYRVSQKNVPL